MPSHSHIIIAIGVLIAAVSIAALALAAVAYTKIKPYPTPEAPSSKTTAAAPTVPPVSNSKGFKDAADYLLGAMNTSADPCEDFFEYACGKWNADHQATKAQPSFYVYNVMQTTVDTQIISSLSEIKSTRSSAINKTKTFYDSCVKTAKSKDSFEGEFLADLDKAIGGWPAILSNWTMPASGKKVHEMLAQATRDWMVNPIVSGSAMIDSGFGTYTNNMNFTPSGHILLIDQADLGLPSPAYYLNDTLNKPLVDSYKAGMKQVADALIEYMNSMNSTTVQSNETDVQMDLDEIFDKEKLIATTVQEDAYRRNHSSQFNKMSVQDLQENYALYNGWDWKEYLQTLTDSIGVTNETMVILDEPAMTKILATYCANFTERDVANMLGWRMAMAASMGINFQSVDEMKRDVAGEDRRAAIMASDAKITAQEAACSEALVNSMPWSAGRVYVEHWFDEESRDQVEVLTQNVIAGFRGMLEVLDWLDDKSRAQAIYKLNNLAQNYGWNTWIFNNELLDRYYYLLHVDPTVTFYEQFKAVTNFFSQAQINKWTNSDNRHDFQMSPAVVNAWYEPTYNSITFPAGILQVPQFRKDFPKSFNYGATGNTPGHEITHGFDDEGVQYYDKGQIFTYMDASSISGFTKMAQCVVDEYSKFVVPGIDMHLNGETNQGENIADNGGIRSAFAAYQMYVAQNGIEPRLPGLEHMTAEQIYFLAFGLSWCGTETLDHVKNRILTDPHSPPRYRVLGTLRNFPEFGKAFGCASGSYMNPPDNERCYVWANPPSSKNA